MPGIPPLLTRFWRPRFSLRTAFIVLVVSSIAFGLVVRWQQNVRKQGEALRWLKARSQAVWNVSKGECSLEYFPDDHVSFQVKLVRKWVDPDYGRRIKDIFFRGEAADAPISAYIRDLFEVERVQIGDALPAESLLNIFKANGLKSLAIHCDRLKPEEQVDWTQVRCANQLNSLHISGPVLLDPDLISQLRHLPSLTKLSVTTDSIDGIKELTKLPHLKDCSIVGERPIDEAFYGAAAATHFDPAITAAMSQAFDHLAEQNELGKLHLGQAMPFDAVSWEKFCKNSPINTLWLLQTNIPPNRLAGVIHLRNLKSLSYSAFRLSDEHLTALKTLKHLESLRLPESTSDVQLTELKIAMPNCEVNR